MVDLVEVSRNVFLLLVFFQPRSFHFYDFLHDVNEVVLLSWCQYDLSNALWVWPILDFDHGALLYLGLEEELLFLAIDVETDFSSSNIDLYPRSAQEWTSKDKRGFLGNIHVNTR